MKAKRLLLAISVISFFTVSLTSCSEDGVMDGGGTAGNPPPPPAIRKSAGVLFTDSIAVTPYLPNN